MSDHVLAIDQGTTSTRAIVFDRAGTPVASAQREHRQILPRAGWVEHDPEEIWANTREVVQAALGRLDGRTGRGAACIRAVGITNQRETTIVWERATGRPVHNAIVWQDTRTEGIVERLAADGGRERFARSTGLPLSGYFSATKIAWMLESVPGLRQRAEAGELAFGTVDSWLLWKLTGGVHGGVHATDATNASRTLLFGIEDGRWRPELLDAFGVPASMLPEVRSSSEAYGIIRYGGPIDGIPVAGILGDQQAAAFGQAAFGPGEAKHTYGTGGFLLLNTGTSPVRSGHGLITTIAYRLGEEPPRYAVEGSIAVAGSLVQWLRDGLGLITDAAEVEQLAASVPDSGGAYLVPAFSGLFAPHWRADARGVLAGLTRFVTKAHLARAALEAIAFQVADVVEAMNADTGARLSELRADGGASANELLMAIQADVLGIPVARPAVVETTALGAAYAAGLATGLWSDLDELRAHRSEDTRWEPSIGEQERAERRRMWRKAVERTLDWVD